MDQNTPSIDENDIFTKFNCPSKTDESKELEVYIKNMDRLPVPNAKDLDALLPWWKVFFLFNKSSSLCIGSYIYFYFGFKSLGQFVHSSCSCILGQGLLM
jgi:hypothetical protein